MGNNQTNRHLIEKTAIYIFFVNKEEFVDNNSNLLFFQSPKIAFYNIQILQHPNCH